ncbi:MAG: hypothetical protein U0638_00140 [Phycisphaerales bacterium]
MGLLVVAPEVSNEVGRAAPVLLARTGVASAEPPAPTPVDPTDFEELEWRLIIELLCAIMQCQSTDPACDSTPSATSCLHARLDRFESEGLLENLSQFTLEAWPGNIDALLDILSGSGWQTYVSDTEERDDLLAQLALLKAALGALIASRGVGGS